LFFLRTEGRLDFYALGSTPRPESRPGIPLAHVGSCNQIADGNADARHATRIPSAISRLLQLRTQNSRMFWLVAGRKVSGGTRSEDGRRGRDTFASLKKTCRKLGISFWNYLKDRTLGMNQVPPLPELIVARSLAR
jgi:hypothetical protein